MIDNNIVVGAYFEYRLASLKDQLCDVRAKGLLGAIGHVSDGWVF